MGVADRGYMRRARPNSVAPLSSWTLRAVVLLVVAHVLYRGAIGWFHRDPAPWLLLSTDALRAGRVWTLFTAALFHADTWHLVFNLLGLWYFGKLVEETLGAGRYLAFLLLAAVLSHVPFVVASLVTGGATQTIGASGVVVAALVFAAFHFPGLPFYLYILPLKLWQLAVLFVAVDVFGALERSSDITDHWTHLGGAAFGFVVYRFGLVPNFRLRRAARPASASAARAPGPYRDGNVRAEIDRLLDKINTDGIGSLTDAEREFLRRNAGQYR